jgi:hypothetical protein
MRERLTFVPTAFFAEFLAGARGLDCGVPHGARAYAKHSLIHGGITPALPSRGR